MSLRVHGRRAIKSPSGLRTRPTSWRVRQAIFDRLRGPVEGSRWLDVCCGVGTIGAEALARGAQAVTGIDLSKSSCSLTRRNWEKVKSADQEIRVMRGHAASVLRRLSGTDEFDVVYVDPPYDSKVYDAALPLIPPLLAEDGLLIVEHDRRRKLSAEVGKLTLRETLVYGDRGVSFYSR